ncbi:MAG TPA: cation:proton antiporter [Ktedonobacterales bacterium]|nr:cation:proton antiporter [Ktedonobacterales bacterium]
MDHVELWFGILAIVLTVAALASGFVDRSAISLPIIFLALGLILGPGALGIIHVSARDPALVAVATLNLALVLFLDAARFDIDELKREWRVPLLDLGPGTILTIAGICVAAMLLLHTSFIQSLLLGAVLASTDPIVLRDIVRDVRIPRSVRRALTIEAGTNDIIVLPIVLIAIEVMLATGGGASYWIGFLMRVLILSPLVGLAVGGIGAWLMGKADERYSIRREYQALYGIGLVLASYSAGQALGGDGFLAAFFAGLAVALFDVTLCDCFMDYGEVTAEMAMLLAFILFGALLGPLFGTISFALALAFAVIAIVVVRPGAMALALLRAKMSPLARGFIAWFGPRGLSALLLALLAVEAGAPQATNLLAIVGVVVLVSVLVHGVSATPASGWYAQQIAKAQVTMAEERESGAAGLFEGEASDIPRVTPQQLHAMIESSAPPIVLDVRSRAHYAEGDGQIPGSIRVLPDQIREWAEEHKDPAAKQRTLIAYCT